jgi:hypothetical protein
MRSNLNMQSNQTAGMSAQDINERRIVKHVQVARALRCSSSLADEIVALAEIQVELWERESLCSKDYIAAWRKLLKHPVEAASMLEERSSRAAALRQNSPFVASVRKFQALAHAT